MRRSTCRSSPIATSPRSTRSCRPRKPICWRSDDTMALPAERRRPVGSSPPEPRVPLEPSPVFESSTREIPPPRAIPRHVAIIMDGNGRWAKQRLLPRVAGHRKGVEAVRATVRACIERGVEFLTLFAFSSENWRRPADEVSILMQLFLRAREQHVSNFLLWQVAYTEFYFTDLLWPDFDAAALDEAIASYQQRERRFGRTSEQLAASR